MEKLQTTFAGQIDLNRGHLNWFDKPIWAQSSKNTAWCLLGCAVGDFGTILWFQIYFPAVSALIVMAIAMAAGILSSIALETVILYRQMEFRRAFRAAIGMSFVSMIAMEVSMNLVDYHLIGGARIVWWAIPPMLLAGFVTPLPYNYWRLRAGNACHSPGN